MQIMFNDAVFRLLTDTGCFSANNAPEGVCLFHTKLLFHLCRAPQHTVVDENKHVITYE